jgi:hypothetical protein
VALQLGERELRHDVLPSMTLKGLKVLERLEGSLSRRERLAMARLLRNFDFDPPNPRLTIDDADLERRYEEAYRRDLAAISALDLRFLG